MKISKKVLALASLVLAAAIPLSASVSISAASTKASNQKVTLNLYTDGDTNVTDTWKILISDFHSANENIEIKVQNTGSGQSGLDKLIAAKKAGKKSTDIDILETGTAGVQQLMTQGGSGILSQMTAKTVPNLSKVIVKTSLKAGIAIPFRGTTVVLAYNSSTVKNPPKTADQLYAWIKANPGRFAYNDPSSGGSGESFVVTAVYNQLPSAALNSSDTKWEKQWDKGFTLLKSLNSFMYKASGKVQYPKGNNGTLALLGDGQVDMIPAWADQFLTYKAQGLLPDNDKMTQISPAFSGDIVTLTVPSMSQNKSTAYKFINYVISAAGQNTLVQEMRAIPVIDSSKLSKDNQTALTGLKVKSYRATAIGNLENDLVKRWFTDIPTLN
jgi:ABC-type uncharacterized transport system, periplasmic component